MTAITTSFRPSALLAACVILSGAAASAQNAGLEGIARPVGPQESVMTHVLNLRAQATPIDGETAARVYGGRPAKPGAWPAQVALLAEQPAEQGQDGTLYSQFCGGSIIARQWILTAAHCVVDPQGEVTDPAKIIVQTGSNSLGQGDFRPVAAIFPHEKYNPVAIDNDLALIKLAEPIGQSVGAVGAINVLGAGQQVPEGPAIVTGWGLMEGDKMPDDLMETDIDIVPNATCNRGMAEQTKRDFGAFLMGMGTANKIPQDKLEEAYNILVSNLGDSLSDNMICAGVASGERTSCNGDSGGPLIVRNAEGNYVQVGIVSWGRIPLDSTQRCGHPELYGVYTRVSNYYDWIALKLRTN